MPLKCVVCGKFVADEKLQWVKGLYNGYSLDPPDDDPMCIPCFDDWIEYKKRSPLLMKFG